MRALSAVAETIVDAAVKAVGRGDDDLLTALEALGAPIYVTDAEGVVTHFTRSCVGFAGRVPAAGKDRWCVTWKLYTEDGEFLPHDQCPMALAVRGKNPVRGVTAVAERPDGSRVSFQPFPTPVFAKDGEFLGAINLLIDITEFRQISGLRVQAQRCRRLANGVNDKPAIQTLNLMAAEYEAKASELEQASLARFGQLALAAA